MDLSKKVTQKDIEFETLKAFLRNRGENFSGSLIGFNQQEPTDIRYGDENYQITVGDKKLVEEMRSTISKDGHFLGFRNIFNISDQLLRDTLEKKSIRADKNTILLIDVFSNGGRDWETLENEISKWALTRRELCDVWKEIYLVYKEKNVAVL